MAQNYFGDNLIFLRKWYHMTQNELGKIVGKTCSAISRWEQGKREPQDKDVQAICTHFHLRPEDLMYKRLNSAAINEQRREDVLLLICNHLTEDEYNKVFEFAFRLLAESHPNITLEELNNADL